MYYKENLSLSVISSSYFDQCLLCEVTCQNGKVIAVIYRSPSQSCSELDDFLFSLEKLINQTKQLKPSFTIILGDFNARSNDGGHMISSLLKALILILLFLCMALIN